MNFEDMSPADVNEIHRWALELMALPDDGERRIALEELRRMYRERADATMAPDAMYRWADAMVFLVGKRVKEIQVSGGGQSGSA